MTSTLSFRSDALPDFRQQVVHLSADGPDFDRRIHQACGSNDLFNDGATGLRELVGTWRRRDEHHLLHALFPLREAQRPVVERRWQPEAVRDEHFLARAIAVVHAADLWDSLVAFVHDHEGVVGQVVEKRGWRCTGGAAGEVPGVILDPVAISDLADHLEIEHRPLMQPLRLQQLPLRLELPAVFFELALDRFDGALRSIA